MKLVVDDYGNYIDEDIREGDEDNIELENYHLLIEDNISQGSDEERTDEQQHIDQVQIEELI